MIYLNKNIVLVFVLSGILFSCAITTKNETKQLKKLNTLFNGREIGEPVHYSICLIDTIQEKYGVSIETLKIAEKLTLDKEIMESIYELRKSEFFDKIEEGVMTNPVKGNKINYNKNDSLIIDYFNKSLMINVLLNKYFEKCEHLIEIKAFGGEHRIYFFEKKYWNVNLFHDKTESGVSPYHNSPLFRNLYGDTVSITNNSSNLYGFEAFGKYYKLILPVIIDEIYCFDVEFVFVR